MAKAIFTGEQVKEFSFKNTLSFFTEPDTNFSWFPEHFFVCYGPRYTCNGNRQCKKPLYLCCPGCLHFAKGLNFVPEFRTMFHFENY